jgi:hypothetical protein
LQDFADPTGGPLFVTSNPQVWSETLSAFGTGSFEVTLSISPGRSLMVRSHEDATAEQPASGELRTSLELPHHPPAVALACSEPCTVTMDAMALRAGACS